MSWYWESLPLYSVAIHQWVNTIRYAVTMVQPQQVSYPPQPICTCQADFKLPTAHRRWGIVSVTPSGFNPLQPVSYPHWARVRIPSYIIPWSFSTTWPRKKRKWLYFFIQISWKFLLFRGQLTTIQGMAWHLIVDVSLYKPMITKDIWYQMASLGYNGLMIH